jgi:hypothetical protein
MDELTEPIDATTPDPAGFEALADVVRLAEIGRATVAHRRAEFAAMYEAVDRAVDGAVRRVEQQMPVWCRLVDEYIVDQAIGVVS